MTTTQQKQLGLVIFMLIYSGLMFWYTVYNINVVNVYPVILTAAIIAVTFWVALLTITLGLLESPFPSLSLVMGLPVLLTVVGGFTTSAIGAAVVLAIILAAGQNFIRAEIKGRIKFRILPTFFNGTRYVLFGLIIIIAGLSMDRIIDEFNGRGLQVPETYIEAVSRPIIKVLTGPNFTLLSSAAVDQAVARQIDQAYPNLPPEEKLKLQQQVQAQSSNPLAEINDQLPQMITSVINQQLALITRDNPVITAVAIIIGLILVSRIFVPIIAFPIVGLIALILIIVQHLGFVFIIKTQTTVERLKL